MSVGALAQHPDFNDVLNRAGIGALRRDQLDTLQVNLGKVCNQACHHCHVGAGPRRTERMERRVAERVVELLAGAPGVGTLDITGGAPELNDHFRFLVTEARGLGRRVIDRCNLTVLLESGQEDLADFLANHRVEITASLPCYTPDNVDGQRGRGTFEASIEALGRLNGLGYGHPGTGLILNLVYNPGGPFLPPDQSKLQADYQRELGEGFGIVFNELLTLTNMPIARFRDGLIRDHREAEYFDLLVTNFNVETCSGLMCRSLLSVDWEGRLYDCDFNQMLELPAPLGPRRGLRVVGQAEPSPAVSLFDIETLGEVSDAPIATAAHCFGCTAGAGSSCAGAVVSPG